MNNYWRKITDAWLLYRSEIDEIEFDRHMPFGSFWRKDKGIEAPLSPIYFLGHIKDNATRTKYVAHTGTNTKEEFSVLDQAKFWLEQNGVEFQVSKEEGDRSV